MVPNKSQCTWHTPGGVGRTVVVDVVVVTTVVDVLDEVRRKISDISIFSAPCCSNIFSMLNGVVDTVGHPVNSVVALKLYFFIISINGDNKKKKSAKKDCVNEQTSWAILCEW